MGKSYIICAAIHFDDNKKHIHQPKNIKTGFVIAGRRHHNCFSTFAILSGDITKHNQYKKTQGFITNDDRFVNREDASIIAVSAGQTKKTDILFSEDLY